MKTIKSIISTSAIVLSMITVTTAFADESTEAAKKLANPIAAMISVPFQYNYDSDIGKFDTGSKSLVNIQPVIPMSIDDEWNLITRIIMPVVWQSDIGYNPVTDMSTGSQSGIGSTTLSLWASPKAPTENGWIWGAGAVFLLPTATDDLIGGDQWGTGPTGIVLKQDGHWTYGGLFNHVWSFAEDKNAKISNTFLQPFLAYVTPEAITYSLNTESTYNWETEEWSVPINAAVSKVFKFGTQLVSLQAGVGYWAVSDSDNTPEGWRARAAVTFIFPK
jgi:hypothetical protein